METLDAGLDALKDQDVKSEPDSAELASYESELKVWFPSYCNFRVART